MPAIALLMLVLSVASTRAQITRTPPRAGALPKVTVFSGNGATQVPKKARASRSQGRAAPPLDLNTIRAAVKASGGKDVSASDEYATLTPIKPSVANRAFLYVAGSILYSAAPDNKPINLYYDPSSGSELAINLKPAAGQTYLIDFSVRVYAGETLSYFGPGGNSNATFAQDGDQHILFLLNATDAEWKQISIVPSDFMMFYSCKVTTVQ
ncbi:MAG: hypothetical protein QOF61_1332 [Acidobacteriota bacterium]|nr:hypothetical protein [Acidobacteriota bacterium]